MNCFIAALTDTASVQLPSFSRLLEEAVRTSQGKSAVAASYPYYMASACVLYKLVSRMKLGKRVDSGLRLCRFRSPIQLPAFSPMVSQRSSMF